MPKFLLLPLPENNDPKSMEQNNNEGKKNIDNEQDLADIKTPMLVRDMVEDKVRESGDVGGHVVVGYSGTDGRGEEPRAKEQSRYQCLKGFLRNHYIFFFIINVDYFISPVIWF